MKRNKPAPRSGQRSARQSKKRLQRVIALIFAGLALPVYLLFDRVYAQLENETFFVYRAQAEDLAARIQERFQEIFALEDRRPFAQYSFFNVQENPLLQTKGVNFSPLSKLPPDSRVPGIIGYFQINPDGSFHSPVLPDLEAKGSTTNTSGLSRSELDLRKQQLESLRTLLAVSPNGAESDEMSNRHRKDSGSKFRDSAKQKGSRPESHDAQAGFEQMFDLEKVGRSAVSAANDGAQIDKAESATVRVAQSRSNQKPLDASALGKLNIDARLWADKTRFSDETTKRYRKKTDRYGIGSRRKERVEIPDQAAAGDYFKSLSEHAAPSPASIASESKSDYASPYASIRTDKKEAPKKQNEARISRPSNEGPVRILSFESEIDSLRMIVLDNLHVCFYRRVWRDNGRYIQGFIARRQALLTEIVKPLLRNSPMEKFSRLLIAYRGTILEQIEANNNAYASGFDSANGEQQASEPEGLIYRTFLGAPVDEVELLFSAAKIPESPGALVVNSAAVSFLAVLSLGLFALYRIGIRQIELAQQHRNFVSAISHELKTPLTSIRMYGDMLLSGWVADDKKAKSYYDYIVSESERLSRLIANVLQLTKLDNDSAKPRLKPYSLAVLLAMIEEKNRAQCDAAGFTLNILDLDGDSKDLQLETDEDAFLQIFINLIDNALKFSANAEPKQIDVGVETETGRDGRATFFVRDYGPGVEPAQMKKIFQLFYRAGDELTRTKPGTGIGLTLVKQLAAMLNAHIDLTNRQPGAEFMVSFPLLDKNLQ